jgi:drug/metabolite transporter (DMT)-like permease
MLVGGAAVSLVGLALGEARGVRLTAAGVESLAYLVLFGSIVGYSAYSYALHHASATAVGTYAYVNPLIAVLLGALLLREPVGPRTLLAMALILGAVLWIQVSHALPARRAAEVPASD